MYRYLKYLPLILIITLWLVPELSSAQGGFVNCEGSGCSACNFVDMANKIIKWILGMVFMIFAVLMTVAGFGLVTSGGNPSALSAAKAKFTNALIGIVIVFSAWLIVNTIMVKLVSDGTTAGNITGWGPWSQVQCQTQTQTTAWPGDPSSPVGSGGTPPTPLPGPAPTGCTGGACVPLGIPCSNPSSCSISPDLVSKFQSMHSSAGVSGARVTEAMPPTRTHKSQCHNNGTCVDYSKQGGMTADEVKRVINAAWASGLRPVYEVKTETEKIALVAGGVPAKDVLVLGAWISAPHFSIYGY
jgi:Type IV secretion system pilin